MVEQLENELKEVKAKAFDMENAYAKFKQEIAQQLAELDNKIAEVKGNDKAAVVETEVQQEPVVEENAPVIVPEEQQDAAVVTTIGDNPEVPSEPVIATEPEVGSEPQVEGLPLIQPTPAPTEISSAPALDNTPLGPTVDVQNTVMPKPEEKSTKTVVVKTDANPAKAIVVTQEQFKNARGSEELQKGIVLGTAEMTNPAPVIPTMESVPTTEANPIVEIPTVEKPAVVTALNAGNDLESMMQQQQEAYAAGDIKTAEAIGNELIKKREIPA